MSNPAEPRLPTANRASQCAALATALFVAPGLLSRPAHADPRGEDILRADASASIAVDGAGAAGEPAPRGAVGIHLEVSSTQTVNRLYDAQTSPDDKSCCLFMFHSVDPNEVEGVGARLDAAITGQQGDGAELDAVIAQEGFARLAGWNLSERIGFNRAGSFRDAFWRSGRDTLEAAFDLDAPPMWGLGDPRRLVLAAGALRVGYGERLASRDLSTRSYELDIELEGLTLHHRRFDLLISGWRFREWGVPETREGDIVTGVSVSRFDLDMVGLDLHLGSVELSAVAGFHFNVPLSNFESNVGPGGGSSQSDGQVVVAPTAWLSAAFAVGELEMSLGAGTTSRLSADGHAVDIGARGELAASSTIDVGERAVRVELALDAAGLERHAVGAMAPADIDPVGTRLWLGRATGSVSVPINERLRIGAEIYGEHSDRDDPQRHTAAPSAVEPRFGVELNATMALRPNR